MSTFVFGIRVTLNDYQSILAEDKPIGLYNVDSDLSGNAAAAQKVVNVDDATYFRVGAKVLISDDAPQSEIGIIDSIAVNAITLKDNLTYAYTIAQNAKLEASSEFRWLYNEVTGVSNWNHNMLQEKGLSKVIKSAPIEQGGAIADIGGITIKLKNTQQFYKDLDDLGISLLGKRVEEIYFEDTTEHPLFDGNCNSVSAWTKGSYTFSAAKPRNKRNALMSRELNSKDDKLEDGSSQIGKMVPLTWGHWKEKPVKFIRSADEQTEYIAEHGYIFVNEPNNLKLAVLLNSDTKIFPVVDNDGNEAPEMYKIKLSNEPGIFKGCQWWQGVPISSGVHPIIYFNDMYIKVTGGDGQGLFRQIASAQVDLDDADNPDGNIIEFTLKSVFPLTLAGNLTATAADQSWVKIIDIDSKYKAELAPCKDYLDNEGIAVSQGLDLFTFESEKTVNASGDEEIIPVLEKPFDYLLIPKYAYKDSGSGNKNEIEIEVALFNNSLDQVDSFLILPINTIELYKGATLEFWNLSDYVKMSDGLFKKISSTKCNETSVVFTGDFAPVTDKHYTVYWERQSFLEIRNAVWRHMISFKLPDIPEKFSNDFSLYMMIYMRCGYKEMPSGNDPSFVNIRYKHFMGDHLYAFDKQNLNDSVAAPVANNIKLIDGSPDFYYEAGVPIGNKNKSFYFEKDITTELLGYVNFDFADVKTKDEYNAIKDNCALSIRRDVEFDVDYPTEDIIRIYEMAIMFKKNVSIKEEVFSYLQGRIFNDTFDGRKTSADLQESIIDMFEGICRSEDWSDRGTMPTDGWGRSYSESALIKTTGTGSFDSTRLNEIRAFKCARQVLNKQEMYTEHLKKTICRNFFLLNYQDKDGKECLVPLEKSLTSPSNIVTLADIRLVNGRVTVKPANPNNIYPEPFVRYYKDIGSDKLDGYIGVTNVTGNELGPIDGTKASWVLGPLSVDESVALYDMCVTNYNISGIITKPPAEMTDLLWANGLLVNAEEIAKWYIFKWVNWMGLKKVSFPVHFTHASAGVNTRDWDVGQTFLLQLPHETNNVQIECLCCRHVIDPNSPNHIQIEAFMLDTVESIFFIQEVMYTAAEGADLDVQETMDILDTNIQEVT